MIDVDFQYGDVVEYVINTPDISSDKVYISIPFLKIRMRGVVQAVYQPFAAGVVSADVAFYVCGETKVATNIPTKCLRLISKDRDRIQLDNLVKSKDNEFLISGYNNVGTVKEISPDFKTVKVSLLKFVNNTNNTNFFETISMKPESFYFNYDEVVKIEYYKSDENGSPMNDKPVADTKVWYVFTEKFQLVSGAANEDDAYKIAEDLSVNNLGRKYHVMAMAYTLEAEPVKPIVKVSRKYNVSLHNI